MSATLITIMEIWGLCNFFTLAFQFCEGEYLRGLINLPYWKFPVSFAYGIYEDMRDNYRPIGIWIIIIIIQLLVLPSSLVLAGLVIIGAIITGIIKGFKFLFLK